MTLSQKSNTTSLVNGTSKKTEIVSMNSPLFVRKKHKDVLLLSGKELDRLLDIQTKEKNWKALINKMQTITLNFYNKCQRYFAEMSVL